MCIYFTCLIAFQADEKTVSESDEPFKISPKGGQVYRARNMYRLFTNMNLCYQIYKQKEEIVTNGEIKKKRTKLKEKKLTHTLHFMIMHISLISALLINRLKQKKT